MTIPDPDTQDRRALLAAALGHVPFDGWSQKALNAGARDLDLDEAAAARLFPAGPSELLSFATSQADVAMLVALSSHDLTSLKIRERIALAVRLRIEYDIPHREAVARAAAYLALPLNQPLAAKCLYATVHAMWHGIGDTSVDFNFYSKRALLAGVVSSTVLFWLQDDSDDFAQTWLFLDRRINDVLKIQKARSQIERAAQNLPFLRKMFRST
jgi:ubiquinone biosynthesis protein COQ9